MGYTVVGLCELQCEKPHLKNKKIQASEISSVGKRVYTVRLSQKQPQKPKTNDGQCCYMSILLGPAPRTRGRWSSESETKTLLSVSKRKGGRKEAVGQENVSQNVTV